MSESTSTQPLHYEYAVFRDDDLYTSGAWDSQAQAEAWIAWRIRDWPSEQKQNLHVRRRPYGDWEPVEKDGGSAWLSDSA